MEKTFSQICKKQQRQQIHKALLQRPNVQQMSAYLWPYLEVTATSICVRLERIFSAGKVGRGGEREGVVFKYL